MKVIILAAGEGVRMRPLTLSTPKPLLLVGGRSILDHIFESLPSEITEAIIVVRYLGDKIRDYCGDNFYGRAITYVEGSPEGNAISFLQAKKFLENEERFLLIQGDELPYKKDVKECLNYTSSSLCFEVSDPWNHGVATLDHDGYLVEVIEKPKNPQTCLISNGLMVVTNKIFECIPEKDNKKEFYFSTMFNEYIKKVKVKAVCSKYGIGGFSSPDDIEIIEKLILKRPK